MALSSRTQKANPEPIRETKKKEAEIIALHVAAHDNEAVEDIELEKKIDEKIRAFPHLKLDRNKVRMFNAFKIGFKNELPSDPTVVVFGAERHVEVNIVFDNVLNLEETLSATKLLKSHGVEAKKLNPERQSLPEDASIFIAPDEDTRATRRFIKNIARRGWLLCRANMAAHLLQTSNKFKCLGTLSDESGRHLSKSRREDYWEYTVGSDAEWKAASEHEGEDGAEFVTYDEAVEALRNTGRATGETSGHVLENYKRLLEEARGSGEQDSGGDEETITYKNDTMKQAIELKFILPLNHEHKDRLFILKREIL
ncbi:hypothetical protein C4585_00990 [Candidatus Parcubacteria bacterium]|nr:MAG: hypothetical protein C4585_00990 [Candidatus Parcubacteria bacterium]